MRRRLGGWRLGWVGIGVAAVAAAAAVVILRPQTATSPPVPPAGTSRDSPPPAPRGPSREAEPGPIVLRDVTRQAGVAFHHTDGNGGKRYIVETVASGLATLDYDGDGWIDIYFLNGRPLKGTTAEGPPPRNALYRNAGQFRFEDVTERSGAGDPGYGLGVCAGDYDNDGHPDLYVSNFGPKVLYRNRGDGTFTDVTRQAGVADGNQVGAGVCFFDMDNDGDLDLYVANYVDFAYETYAPKVFDGVHVYRSPTEYSPLRHTLFRNEGNGTFTDVSMESGIGNYPGTGMGMISADYDEDGSADLLVLNDVFGNFCFRNDGSGKFQEVSLASGFKYNANGMELGSMGIDAADYDHDGHLDFFQTSYQGELPVLFRNRGNGTLEDVTLRSGAGAGTVNNVKWGCGFADFDNDGHQDLFIGLGHLQDNVELFDKTTSREAHPVLLRNCGDGRFVDVSQRAGDGMKVKVVARGIALDDLDNDGRVDVVILSARGQAVLLRNESETANHWLQIEVRGVKANRDGVGARVRVVAGDLAQTAEVHSGRGYQSHFGSRLHFGLGRRDRVDRVEVHWPGGGVDALDGVGADQRLTVVEGRGRGNGERSGSAAPMPAE